MPKLSLCHNWKLTCLKQSELPFQLYLSVGSFRKQTKKTNRLVADIVTLATQIIIATWIHSILVLKKINSFPRHWLSEWCESTTHLFNISFFFLRPNAFGNGSNASIYLKNHLYPIWTLRYYIKEKLSNAST